MRISPLPETLEREEASAKSRSTSQNRGEILKKEGGREGGRGRAAREWRVQGETKT